MIEFLTAPDTLGYLAGGSLVLGYLIINQIVLRCLILVGTGFYISYYATVADDPLWVAIYLSIAQGSATAIGLGLLLLRRSRLAIPSAYADLYQRFHHLPPGDFRAFMRKANRYVAQDDEILGEAGATVDRLVYIVSGGARVQKLGESFSVPGGIFIGEVAYLLGTPAAATTILQAGSEVVVWQKRDLEAASARNPRFQLALEAAISRDMAAKVALAVAPVDMRQNSAEPVDHPFDIVQVAQ